jgi:hypothetical protein
MSGASSENAAGHADTELADWLHEAKQLAGSSFEWKKLSGLIYERAQDKLRERQARDFLSLSEDEQAEVTEGIYAELAEEKHEVLLAYERTLGEAMDRAMALELSKSADGDDGDGAESGGAAEPSSAQAASVPSPVEATGDQRPQLSPQPPGVPRNAPAGGASAAAVYLNEQNSRSRGNGAQEQGPGDAGGLVESMLSHFNNGAQFVKEEKGVRRSIHDGNRSTFRRLNSLASDSILTLMHIIPESSRAPLRLFLGRELPEPIRAPTWKLFLKDPMARAAYVETRNSQVTNTISSSDLRITDRCQALLKEQYMGGRWYSTGRLMTMKAALSYYHTTLNERAKGYVHIPEEAYWLVIPLIAAYENERGLENVVEGLEAVIGKQLEVLDLAATTTTATSSAPAAAAAAAAAKGASFSTPSRPLDPMGREHATVPREWAMSIAMSLEELDEELDHFIRGLPAHQGDAKGATFAPVDSVRLAAALGKRGVQVGMSDELTLGRLRERLISAKESSTADASEGEEGSSRGLSADAKPRRRPSPQLQGAIIEAVSAALHEAWRATHNAAHGSTEAGGEPFPAKWRPSRFTDVRDFEKWYDESKHRRIVRNAIAPAPAVVPFEEEAAPKSSLEGSAVDSEGGLADGAEGSESALQVDQAAALKALEATVQMEGGMGKEVNINTDYPLLPPRWKDEYRKDAKCCFDYMYDIGLLAKTSSADERRFAEEVHRNWMQQNPEARMKEPELFKKFNDLDLDAQARALRVVRACLIMRAVYDELLDEARSKRPGEYVTGDLVYVFETALAPALRRGLVSCTSPEGALFVWDQCVLLSFAELLPKMAVVLLIALREEVLKCYSAEEISHVLETAGACYTADQLQRVMEESGIESTLRKAHNVRRPAGLDWTPSFRHDDSALHSVLENSGYTIDPSALSPMILEAPPGAADDRTSAISDTMGKSTATEDAPPETAVDALPPAEVASSEAEKAPDTKAFTEVPVEEPPAPDETAVEAGDKAANETSKEAEAKLAAEEAEKKKAAEQAEVQAKLDKVMKDAQIKVFGKKTTYTVDQINAMTAKDLKSYQKRSAKLKKAINPGKLTSLEGYSQEAVDTLYARYKIV